MGRVIPKTNPKYDHGLDVDLVVPASRAEVANAIMAGLHENIEVEEHSPDRLVLSGKSAVKIKNIWIEVAFADGPVGTRITSRIAKAHTSAWIYLFYIGIGPRRVRGINTYRTLTSLWRANLRELGANESAG